MRTAYGPHDRAVLVCLLVGVLLAPAWAGPFTDEGTQPILTYPLKNVGDCSGCHGQYDGGNNIEPWDTWAGSMMAQAGRDPIFWAAMDVANNDIPDVGEFCLRCHVPIGWLDGRSEPPGGSTDGCGFQGKLDESNQDFDGLNCHFCHRMMVNPSPPGGQDPVYYENGKFWLDDSNCGGEGEPCRRGPYDYPADGTPAPHAWAHSEYHESSNNCGNCHNVTHPAFNLIVDGVDTGVPFPIERTFREWRLSDFSDSLSAEHKTCQNCHMPDATVNPAYACDSQENNHTGDMPIHQLAGGNAWIPDVLRQEYPNLDLSSNFNATEAWALVMLQNESAEIAVTTPDTVYEGSNLELDVRVTNLTGHKLPTGYPEGRRMWLNVQVRDGLNDLIWESGAYDALTGVLTQDSQAKVYEMKPGIWNFNGTNECDCEDASGNPLFHFVLNNCVEKDNRIPPQGFTGGSDLETQPVSYTYPETSPGSGVLVNYDDTSYSIPIAEGTQSPVTVSATLRYQTMSKEYVDFLLAEAVENAFPIDCIERSAGFPTQSRGEILYDMWTAYDRCPPVDMVTDGASVVVDVDTGVSDGSTAQLRLSQSYPNPASPAREPTRISYYLPADARVTVEVHTASGRLVRTLVNRRQPRGPQFVLWDGTDDGGEPVASGIYFYRLTAGGEEATKRMVVLR